MPTETTNFDGENWRDDPLENTLPVRGAFPPDRPQTTLDEDEIIDACDYPGEAAEMIAKHRGCSFAKALLIVDRAMEKNDGR